MARLPRWILVGVCSVALVGCQAGPATGDAPIPGGDSPAPAPVVSTPETTVVDSAVRAPLPPDAPPPGDAPPGPLADPDAVEAQIAQTELHNDRVLTAAVMIVSAGDVEAAVQRGAFTEEELDAAFEAIQTGTLSRYAD